MGGSACVEWSKGQSTPLRHHGPVDLSHHGARRPSRRSATPAPCPEHVPSCSASRGTASSMFSLEICLDPLSRLCSRSQVLLTIADGPARSHPATLTSSCSRAPTSAAPTPSSQATSRSVASSLPSGCVRRGWRCTTCSHSLPFVSRKRSRRTSSPLVPSSSASSSSSSSALVRHLPSGVVTKHSLTATSFSSLPVLPCLPRAGILEFVNRSVPIKVLAAVSYVFGRSFTRFNTPMRCQRHRGSGDAT